jgi:hypothetical protein
METAAAGAAAAGAAAPQASAAPSAAAAAAAGADGQAGGAAESSAKLKRSRSAEEAGLGRDRLGSITQGGEGPLHTRGEGLSSITQGGRVGQCYFYTRGEGALYTVHQPLVGGEHTVLHWIGMTAPPLHHLLTCSSTSGPHAHPYTLIPC